MFLIREAGPKDFRGAFSLAKALDSYNLPADGSYIRQLLQTSEESFAGLLAKPKARYLFVLEREKKIVGCSLIIAKHGTPGHPHLWFSEEQIEKSSRTLGTRRSHPVLRLGYTEDGPTEVGGFVVLPRYRGRPERCGLQLSYVRFLYMAMHPERFEKTVLIEYRGAMGAGGKSPFWEAIGRVFTGLSYQRADRLSARNKEFILGLLPSEPIYCALLPESVQRAIGAIHPAAQPAAALAARIGFRPIPQVEPFDGGPYYSALRKEIKLVRETRKVTVATSPSPWPSPRRGEGGVRGFHLHLVATEAGGCFRAVLIRGTVSSGRFTMEEEGFDRLKVHSGDQAYVCAVPR